jgi:hypothetical protein
VRPLPFSTITDVSARESFGSPTGAAARGFGVTGAKTFASAALRTWSETGFASSVTPRPIRTTSSTAATAEATSVAVRHGELTWGRECSTAA